jgi:4-hydroxy-2-oxoglutarate aldolase
MHFKLSPELVLELSKHPNIIGIKDSSGDLELLGGYLRSQSESFTVITGNGGQLHPALTAGARAGILAVALFAAERSVEVYDLHARSDHAAAERVQATLKPLAVSIVAALGVPGVKAAMDAVGLAGGPVRGPLVDLDAGARAGVGALVEGLAATVA